MRARIPRILAGGLAAVAATAVIGGAALAQTPPAGPTGTARPTAQQRAEAFLNALASKLGKTPQEVRDAIVGVQKDRIAQEVKDGRLTQQQADQLNQRLAQSGGLGGLGRFKEGFEGRGHRGGPPEGGRFGIGSADLAGFLGLQPQDLANQLRAGRSLAQIAQDKGKSRDDLKNHLTAQAKSQLDQAVQAGRLTRQQADQRLTDFSSRLDQTIDRTGATKGRPGRPARPAAPGGTSA